MLYCKFSLKDCISRLNTLSTNTKEKSDIEEVKVKFYTIAYDMLLSLHENHILSQDYKYRLEIDCLINRISKIKELEEPIKIKQELLEIIGRFNNENYDIGLYTFVTNDANSDNGPNMSEFINLSRSFEINRKINILHLSSDYTNIKKNIFESFNHFQINPDLKADIYSVTLNNSIYYSKKEVCKKLIIGANNKISITNDAFDMVFLSPQVDKSITNSTSFSVMFQLRERKESIKDAIRYLRPNGHLILTMPYYRVEKDIAKILARFLDNIEIRSAYDIKENRLGYITIIGTKNPTKEVKEEEYQKLRKIALNQDFKHLNECPLEKRSFPDNILEIRTFRGSVIQSEEVFECTDESNIFNEILKEQSRVKFHSDAKPLLPFNLGQIGLILTSGCLDGIIEEGNGHCHVIKGRVKKHSEEVSSVVDENEDDDDDFGNPAENKTKVQETISNKVEINLLLPDGTLKTLA